MRNRPRLSTIFPIHFVLFSSEVLATSLKMAEMMAGLNLVLLGKTGAGKSSSGNTILGRQAFVSNKSSRSVTQDVAVESGAVCGLWVTVYDTPGLSNSELSEDEVQQKHEEVLLRFKSGHCVFLLVIKADRFTEEEREAVEKIEQLLAEERLKKTWILFTGEDQLVEEKMTIQEFINDNEKLKKLVQKYEQRYHVFNNKKKILTEQLKTRLLVFMTIQMMGIAAAPCRRQTKLSGLLSRHTQKSKPLHGHSADVTAAQPRSGKSEHHADDVSPVQTSATMQLKPEGDQQ
ncbi:GTPase IMAP family member GIMD1-like [Pseudorasbora parva]|uniref:GTPase IMAP family member GIMD1-like n=1 Tax=Pseudorasbora parva TaxID=51549 RepID=UPI00351F12F4